MDYPLAPGESAVLATDAIDHRPLFSKGLDLRESDFEFYGGPGDVDNPDVPNALDVGQSAPLFGHGLFWTSLAAVAWVARPFELTTVPTQVITVRTWGRIPANALLEVISKKTTYRPEYRECDRLVHPNFDRREMQFLGANPDDDLMAFRRRELPFAIDGQLVLQHTGTSAWDLTTAARSPFTWR